MRWYISFLHFNTFKIQVHGVPPLHYILICKMHIYITKMNFKPVNIDTVCFFYRKVVNFWYITCFFPQYDSNLAPIPIRRLFQLKNWKTVWGDAEMLSFFWTWNQSLEMFLLPQAMKLSAINYFRRFFKIFMGKACKILAGSNWLYTFT